MRAKELRSRSDEELGRLEEEAADQLFRARLDNATHQLDDSSKITRARRELARIKTVQRERELGLRGAADGDQSEKE